MNWTIVFFFYLWTSFVGVSVAQDYPNESEILRFVENDHYIGDLNAKVVLIEYSSLSCPGCAFFHEEVLPKIKEDYINSGKVLYIFRDYPVNEQGLYGAILPQCFSHKYFEVLDMLFKSQKSWAFRKNFKAMLWNIAKLSGLDVNKLNQCFDDKQMVHNIQKTAYISMKVLDINSTPTFFINGDKITGARNNYEYFTKMLDKYVEK